MISDNDVSQKGGSTNSMPDDEISTPETEWERLIHKMAKPRADIIHLQEEGGD